MREAFGAGLLSKLGALLSAGALKRLKSKMDPNNVNGGVFLGLNGIVVKSHGGADAQGFATALKIAIEMAESDFGSHVNANLQKFAASRAETGRDGNGKAEAENGGSPASTRQPSTAQSSEAAS
jgi:glycerol-3-phosphate acyltransferase PlsX